MTWLDRLEKKWKWNGIPNLVWGLIILQVAGYVLNSVIPGFYYDYLCMDASAILRGQIWRVVTFLMAPGGSVLYFLLGIYVLYWIGTGMERAMGTFRFTVYVLCWILFQLIFTVIAYLITGVSYIPTIENLDLSLLLAYAFLYPTATILLFFILPIRAKWLGVFGIAYFAFIVIRGLIPASLWATLPSDSAQVHMVANYLYRSQAISALATLCVFALFYRSLRGGIKVSRAQKKRQKEFRREFKVYDGGADKLVHRCEVCGRTSQTNPELEFRFCSKCGGTHEYCMDHLYTHSHVGGEGQNP